VSKCRGAPLKVKRKVYRPLFGVSCDLRVKLCYETGGYGRNGENGTNKGHVNMWCLNNYRCGKTKQIAVFGHV